MRLSARSYSGWQIVVRNMCEGDKWSVYFPAAYGYGPRGVHVAFGNLTLIFEIRLRQSD